MGRIGLIAVLGACTPPTEPTYAELLDDPVYRFCHDELEWIDRPDRWCPVVAELPDDRCPGLRRTCASLRERCGPDYDCPTPASGCVEEGASSDPEAPPEPPRGCLGGDDDEAPGQGCVPGSGGASGPLTAVLRWVAALVVALVVGGLAVALARVLARRRPAVAVPPAAAAAEAPVDLVDAADDEVPALPSTDLLGRARAAREAGDLALALQLARAAALRDLADRGWLRLDASRTDRELARSVRRRPEVHEPLRFVLAVLEELRWGGRMPTRERVDEVLRAAERVLQVGAVLGWVVLALGPTPAQARPDAYGTEGRAAVFDDLQQSGWEPRWRTSSLRSLDASAGRVIVDTSRLSLDGEDWAALGSWVEAGGVLLVVGSADGLAEVGPATAQPGPAELYVTWLEDVPVELPERPWPRPLAYRAAEVVDPEADTVDGSVHPWVFGGPVGARHVLVGAIDRGEGVMVFLADPALASNAALLIPENRGLLGSLLAAADQWIAEPADHQGVELALTAGDAAGVDPLSALIRTRLGPTLLQLLLVLAVAAWWLGAPFGTPRPRPPPPRDRFADHARALGARYRALGAVRGSASAVIRWWFDEVGEDGLLAALQRAGRTPAEAAEAVAAWKRLRDDPDGEHDEHDLERVEDLWTVVRQR